MCTTGELSSVQCKLIVPLTPNLSKSGLTRKFESAKLSYLIAHFIMIEILASLTYHGIVHGNGGQGWNAISLMRSE